jgi:DNA-binding response OmpR family regulator
MQILLVEDDAHLSASLSEALTAQRYVVDLVKDGEAAWERVNSFTYDLILMDLTLPKLDGIQLCQRLRNHGRRILVLMLAAPGPGSPRSDPPER